MNFANLITTKAFQVSFNRTKGYLDSPQYISFPKTKTSLRSFTSSRKMSSTDGDNKNFQFKMNQRLAKFGPTVWHEFTPLAQKYGAVNLGQGFPNFDGPDFVLNAAKEAISKGLNQYARSGGHPRLVNQLSKLYSPLFGREINAMTEVIVTCGASEGIFATLEGILSPGDEIVLIEPFFDIYLGGIAMADAKAVYVPLRLRPSDNPSSADFYIDCKELEAAITPKTKCIILNNPHNPTGKVFSRQELEELATVFRKFPNLVVISDEVYEWMTYDGVKHERIATLPGMWERTVTLSSAGKTFSATGWKIGWAIGPANIISAIGCAHQFIPFSVATPLQEAVAVGLEIASTNDFFSDFKKQYTKRRDILVQGLKEAGLKPYIPQGTFFCLADCSSIQVPSDVSTHTITGLYPDVADWNMCRYLTADIGVAAIPPSSFYCEEHIHMNKGLVRFAFCKTEKDLEEACKRLQKLKKNT